MLTIFNRKELTITYDMKRLADVRALLLQHGIGYDVRVMNRRSPSPLSLGSRGMLGTFGENLQLEYEYRIYVHRSDYDRAFAIINEQTGL